MFPRARLRLGVLGPLVLAALALRPLPAEAFVGVFRLTPPTPPALEQALAHYRSGDDRGVLAALGQVEAAALHPDYLDELRLLRGLAHRGLGWPEEAAEAFHGELAAAPGQVSVYGPFALLEWVELEAAGPVEVARLYHRFAPEQAVSWLRRWGRPDGVVEEGGGAREPWPGRSDRVAERLAYRVGQALYRSGAYDEAAAVLERIGSESRYFPFARFTLAQLKFALGDAVAAERNWLGLRRWAPRNPVGAALRSRADFARAQAAFSRGEIERAADLAAAAGRAGTFAPAARLLHAEIEAGRGAASRARWLLRDPWPTRDPQALGRRALALAQWAPQGDDEVSRILLAARRALEGELEDVASGRELVAGLRWVAEASRSLRAQRRGCVADALERALRLQGPLTIGGIFRVIAADHRHSTIGAAVVDVDDLSRCASPPSPQPTPLPATWLDWISAPERPELERVLADLAGLGGPHPESATLGVMARAPGLGDFGIAALDRSAAAARRRRRLPGTETEVAPLEIVRARAIANARLLVGAERVVEAARQRRRELLYEVDRWLAERAAAQAAVLQRR